MKEACFGAEADPEYKQIVKNFKIHGLKFTLSMMYGSQTSAMSSLTMFPRQLNELVEACWVTQSKWWEQAMPFLTGSGRSIWLLTWSRILMEKDCYNV